MKNRDFQDLLAYVYAGFGLLVVIWVYVKTLAPTVSFFDSGELISAAYTSGIAHPPGYPLYVTLGRLFSLLPIGGAAYRLNMMSAFFAALASLMVYAITYRIVVERPVQDRGGDAAGQHPEPGRMLQPIVGMSTAFTFAFSITHWQHAVIAEVYSLNTFLCGVIVLLLITWHQAQGEGQENSAQCRGDCKEVSRNVFLRLGAFARRLFSRVRNGLERSGRPMKKVWMLYLAAWVFGVGFGNHQTIALLALAACALVLLTAPRILKQVKTLLLILLCLVLGLSIYALVPLRAARNPPVNWGNPSTLRQFVWLVTREGYNNVPRGKGVQRLWNELWGTPGDSSSEEPGAPPEAPVPQDLKGIDRLSYICTHSLFLKQLNSFTPLKQFGCIGLALAGLGMIYGLIRHRIITLTLVIGVCSLVLSVVLISDPPEENIFLVEEFHAPAYLLMAVWIGMGAMACAKAVLWVAKPYRRLQYGFVFMLAVFFLLSPAFQVLENTPQADRRRNYVAYDYASNVLTSLQDNAILFTWGDSGAFPLWYLQIVEQQRPDVTLIHLPHLGSAWFVESLPTDLFASTNPYGEHGGDLIAIMEEILRHNMDRRPIYFDFSSAHSIMIPYPLLPVGVTYKLERPGDTIDDEVWGRYRFRGLLDDTRIASDPDIERTFLMYGSARVELGNYYLDLRETEKAAEQFNLAVQFDPGLGEGILQSLKIRDKLGGEQPVDAPQPNVNR